MFSISQIQIRGEEKAFKIGRVNQPKLFLWNCTSAKNIDGFSLQKIWSSRNEKVSRWQSISRHEIVVLPNLDRREYYNLHATTTSLPDWVYISPRNLSYTYNLDMTHYGTCITKV
jgi:hypothetical protein